MSVTKVNADVFDLTDAYALSGTVAFSGTVTGTQNNGWEFVTGGFLDRIGENGEFPKITEDCDIWKEMPNAGFFRYPLSKAEANKVTLLKGKHNVVPGQHFIQFDDGSTSWGKSHPLIGVLPTPKCAKSVQLKTGTE